MKKQSAKADDGKIFFGGRIPIDLRDKLQRKAKRERRSMVCAFEVILSQALSKE
jgi:hypothetical protein